MALIRFSRQRVFDTATGDVTTGEHITRLEPQPSALLAMLVAHPDHLVTHDEIRASLWRDGRHVDYAAGVHYAVRQIRRALDAPGDTSVIETLPRRGYRLATGALAPDSMPEGEGVPALWTRRPLRWAAVALAALVLVALVERRPNDHHAIAVAVVRAVHDAIY